MVCLPGLTRNGRDFTTIATALAAPEGVAQRVIALESRGRGRSGWADPSTYTLGQELKDLTAALDAFAVERAAFIGTSRGGLLAMLLAATAPERVARIVLNDIGPAIDARGLSRIAAAVGKVMEYPSFEDLATALEAGLAGQFPAMNPAQWTRMARQLASKDDAGGVRLDYDPALATPFQNQGSVEADFWPVFNALEGIPVLVVRGANSDILSAATVEAMRRRHRRLEGHVVVNEGHAPLLWDRGSIEAIKTFLLPG